MLALQSPAIVGRLVLESPSAGIADPTERAARRDADEALAHALERDGVQEFVTHWEALPLFASHSRLSPAVRRELHAGRLRNDAEGLAASLRGAGQGTMPSLSDRLAEVRSPTLVVAGEFDPVRRRSESVAAGIPGAQLVVVPDAGHTPHLETPSAFREAVLSFLLPSIPTQEAN
jgi:2-succinyl-6-hydroxy-2,4-cyclohexadiene-1-carboxylate synthase